MHDLLRTLPGFRQDLMLERSSEPGEFTLVTIVEWDSERAMERARTSLTALLEDTNFNPQEMLARLDIKADRAIYRQGDPES